MVQSLPVAVIAVSFMTFVDIVFFFPTTPQTSTQNMNYTVVVLGGILLLSLVWYYFPVYGGVHWFTGPVPNVGNDDAADHMSRNSCWTEKEVGVIVEKRVDDR